jgi:hypothetical protein
MLVLYGCAGRLTAKNGGFWARAVTPVPDPRLGKNTLNTLATAIDGKATFLQLAKPPAGFPVPYGAAAPQVRETLTPPLPPLSSRNPTSMNILRPPSAA